MGKGHRGGIILVQLFIIHNSLLTGIQEKKKKIIPEETVVGGS